MHPNLSGKLKKQQDLRYRTMKNVQHIKRSQFVFNYGPGAIIETNNGPRIIPAINQGLGSLFNRNTFKKFEIINIRLRIAIGQIEKEMRAKIFALPSNAALGRPDTIGLYTTYVFPTWKVCYGRMGEHYNNQPILYQGAKCPQCHKKEDSAAVRFIMACINGHLDDVNWNYAVHHESSEKIIKCKPKFYLWKGGGSSLSDLVIECPQCGASTNMRDIYRIDFLCSGRRPENENPTNRREGNAFFPEKKEKRNCKARMKVIQRQSSSLRIPEIITLLTIPEYDNPISNILQRDEISTAINFVLESPNQPCEGGLSADELVSWIERGLKDKTSYETITVINQYIKEKGVLAFCQLFNKLNDRSKTFVDFIYEEFESLNAGPRREDNFVVGKPKKVSLDLEKIPNIDVFPIEMLKTITAQVGFIRMPYINCKSNERPCHVSSGVYLDNNFWYPGFEGKGEGIFITFSEGSLPKISETKAYKKWKEHKNEPNYTEIWCDFIQKPLFIWLHTLAHAIILTISLHSGYSSASIRERIYINQEANNGGILLYTTSPGKDGSMGGLVGAVDKFDIILEKAYKRIEVCSNDPLCVEVRKTPTRVNGAACHSCLLISETSCEHRNRWLDRHIILGD